MRDLHPDLVTLLQARRGLKARLLLWIVARDRATGDPEPLGLCSDVEPVTVTIGGDSRTYQPAGGLLRADPVVSEAGLVVRMQTVRVSGVAPEIRQALLSYDPRLAPVELHRMVLDPLTGAAAGPPLRLFRGVIDAAPIPVPEKGGTVTIELTLAASSRELTRGLAVTKSDESQRRRDGDRFRRYAAIAGEVDVWWGAARRQPVTAPPTPSKGGATAPAEDPRSGSDR